MASTFPFLTTYDPPGTSEGSIDPLGLYLIADQLGIQLVPAVRERMLRIRFLTAIAVGSLITEGQDGDPSRPDSSPYMVWEWLVVEALTRTMSGDPDQWGVPGSMVSRRALDQHGYLDARGYLKSPRIFGFHGVYKRLANHLGLVNVDLGPGPMAEDLIDVWARGLGYSGLDDAKPLLSRWSTAIRRSLNERPPRTKSGWSNADWAELAAAFAPSAAKEGEKRCVRGLLHATDDHRLGAFTNLWQLQAEFDDAQYREELLHDRLRQQEPGYGPLLDAIRAYEGFARGLQDGFDLIRAEATRIDAHGFHVPAIGNDGAFTQSTKDLHRRFEAAHRALGNVTITNLSLQNLYSERFASFAEPMDAGTCALALCAHHEAVQRAKSVDGKRPWFDRLGPDRIYLRHAYREPRHEIQPGRYVHAYRGGPIRRFYADLS